MGRIYSKKVFKQLVTIQSKEEVFYMFILIRTAGQMINCPSMDRNDVNALLNLRKLLLNVDNKIFIYFII